MMKLIMALVLAVNLFPGIAPAEAAAAETITHPDGSVTTTEAGENGRAVVKVTLSVDTVEAARSVGVGVELPMPAVFPSSDRSAAPAVTLELPDGGSIKVTIPVEQITAGTVAVLVRDDGTEEIIRTSKTLTHGLSVELSDGDTVKIVDNAKPFSDVPADYWGADAVAYVTSRELFAGTSEGMFDPETAMSRGMLVTVLARMEGVDTSGGDPWYEAGRQWAVDNGISDGTDMEQTLTREQLALMLYRYAGQPGGSGDLSAFTDGARVSSWAADAMTWAVDGGLISGVGERTLDPQGEASRAQVAAVLLRLLEQPTF